MNLLPDIITDSKVLFGFLPQRPPFIMVDKLLFFSRERIVSGCSIDRSLLFLDEDVLEAPGLIENMAQTVALHTGYSYHLQGKKAPVGYIGAIKKLTIHTLPRVGGELRTEAVILHDIMGVTLVRAQVTAGGRLLAESEMKTVIAP